MQGIEYREMSSCAVRTLTDVGEHLTKNLWTDKSSFQVSCPYKILHGHKPLCNYFVSTSEKWKVYKGRVRYLHIVVRMKSIVPEIVLDREYIVALSVVVKMMNVKFGGFS